MTAADVEQAVHDQFRDYRSTLDDDRRHLLEKFQVVDIARKVVGVGSVGTRAFIVLLQGRDDQDPLFLQVKEATRSVLEDHLPKSRYRNPGERVVRGQRMMQATSDIFLGWTKGVQENRYLYWRQLRDMKGSALVDTMSAFVLEFYAAVCGGPWPARTPDPATRSPSPPTSAQETSSTPRSPTSPAGTPTRTRSTTRRSSTPSAADGSPPSKEPDLHSRQPRPRAPPGTPLEEACHHRAYRVTVSPRGSGRRSPVAVAGSVPDGSRDDSRTAWGRVGHDHSDPPLLGPGGFGCGSWCARRRGRPGVHGSDRGRGQLVRRPDPGLVRRALVVGAPSPLGRASWSACCAG